VNINTPTCFAGKYTQHMDSFREQSTPSRMLTLDAMRGGAALAVVTYHALGVAPQTAWHGWEGALPQVTGYIVHFAYAGIYLFFVISGYCIHLFWAKTRAAGVQSPVINFLTFWKRRVRRLYPPYIAALVLYLCYLAYKTPVHVTGSYVWDVVLHVFMLHNLDPRTAYSINGAFWTLAIEEQLYLAYFLLLFLRIRYGWTRTLVLCFSARVVWLIMSRSLGYSFGIELPLGEAAATNWFIWALGALSVEAALGVIKLPAWCYRIRAAAVALGCAMALAQILPMFDHKNWLHDIGWLIMHPAWGVGFFVLVNYSVAAEQRWRLISRVPIMVSMLAPIGLISYSLYLTHSFVLMHWYWFGFTQLHILSISLVIMTPLSVLFAWVFFRVCERPFMRPLAVKAPVQTHNNPQIDRAPMETTLEVMSPR
jgi:peptidoglycan/LPS O-acetylase OafA/YrhL